MKRKNRFLFHIIALAVMISAAPAHGAVAEEGIYQIPPEYEKCLGPSDIEFFAVQNPYATVRDLIDYLNQPAEADTEEDSYTDQPRQLKTR